MAKTDDGEFELILGNRQLLSVFFIVVILLGVFFTMGYIVGRNSAPSTADATATSPKTDAKPLVVDSPSREPDTAPAQPESPAAPVQTAAQQPSGSDAASPAAKEEERPKEPAKRERAAEKRPSTNQPEAGKAYLQLAATTEHEADIMVDVLKKKGFKAMASEIDEKPGTFRVLVGPVTEGGTGSMRADLQKAGFPGNAAIRRAF